MSLQPITIHYAALRYAAVTLRQYVFAIDAAFAFRLIATPCHMLCAMPDVAVLLLSRYAIRLRFDAISHAVTPRQPHAAIQAPLMRATIIMLRHCHDIAAAISICRHVHADDAADDD